MEDPKRMRTKLRLDLKDVRRQIEDLEELLKEDKSPENVEAHRKLVEYEKKLKDQYEKMTGLSVDQANNLEKKDIKVGEKNYEKSTLSGFLAFLGGLLVAYGFYNTVLHSIEGFAPTDLLDYLMGTSRSIASINTFMASIIYEISFYLVVIPIGAGALIVLLSSPFEKSRGKLFALLEGIGFLGSAGVFSYILFTSPDATSGVDVLLANLLVFSISVILSGLLVGIGSIGHRSYLRKFLGILSAILIIYTGVQLFLLTTIENTSIELVYQWPFITLPLVIGSGIYAFIGFLRMLN